MDWVVLTAAVVGLGVAVLGVVSKGAQNLSSDIAAQLSGQGTNVPGWSGNGTSPTSGGSAGGTSSTGGTNTTVTAASSTSGGTSSSANKKTKVSTSSTTRLDIQFGGL
ncbi:MAG: hypothetical protein Q9M41_06420 [Paracoccaceae bacterium]|nr:hypothetical protein [Paracoccaceae bacterium]